jgi:pimeloyl-ACP methyl ester carboxylesterase
VPSPVGPPRITTPSSRPTVNVAPDDEGGHVTEFFDRDGVSLAYDAAGRGDVPIVLVHGWACDRSYFDLQYEHFAARHPVVNVDLRGHGESGHPQPGPGVYDIETLADDVLVVSQVAGFERPVVIGHSLGGLVALACAARAGAVRASVMVDPAPIVNKAVKDILREAIAVIENDHDASWRREFVSAMFLPTDTVRRHQIISGMTELAPAIAAALVGAIERFDGNAALAAVTVPLLSIGSASPTNAPADLIEACPTITIGQTVGSGHFNQLEVPDQVNTMIERFLDINPL